MSLFPTNRDLLKKLDFISGTINTIEGIVKGLSGGLKAHTVVLRDILQTVGRIERKLDQPIDKSSFHFSKIKIENVIIEGRINKFTMNEFQFVEATLEGTKKNGSPANWQGDPVIETDRPDAVTAEVVDHKTIRLTGIEDILTEPVAVNVSVKVDADLGEGIEQQEAKGILVVEPGRLTGLKLTFGEPQDKP